MKKTKTILKIIIFPLIIIAILYGIVSLLTYSVHHDEIRLKLFFHEVENSLDVVFIGPSTVRAGIIPTQIYSETGITSYDIAIDSLPLELTKPILEECEETQKSKLYIIDINNIASTTSTATSYAKKKFIDSIADKKRKNYQIKNLIPKQDQFNYTNTLYSNHCNWKWLPDIIKFRSLNLDNESSVLKGFASSYLHAQMFSSEIIDVANYEIEKEPVKENLKELDKLLDYITEQNLNVKFIRMPRFITKSNLHETEILNYAGKLLTERGFSFKDYSKCIDEIGLTRQNFYDPSHINIEGAKLFTSYLINELKDVDVLQNISHSSEVEEDWKKCTSEVNEFLDYYATKENVTLLQSVYDDLIFYGYKRDIK